MAGYDAQGYLPHGLGATQPVWSMPPNPAVPGVNESWWLGVPVGKWNMTSFDYNSFEQHVDGTPLSQRFCALNNKDFDVTDQPTWNGKYGDLFPGCYVRASDVSNNRKFYEQAQQAQTLFSGGKLDAVSEINRIDPWGLQPCAGNRTIFELLLPVAAALFAGIATGELLSLALPPTAPQAIRAIVVVGATAFGWEFASAISESDQVTREGIFDTSSKIAGVAIGSATALGAVYAVSDSWQAHEYIWLGIGAAGGYFVIAPFILPKIDNFGTGIIGVVWRFLNGIVSLITSVVCDISNWDEDGCSVSKNPKARSWDRTLLSAAAVESMADNYDLDEKQKEVAYQAMLLNAATVQTYGIGAWDVPSSRVYSLMNLGPEKAWNGRMYTGDNREQNAFSALGPLVQANYVETPAWYEKLSGGNMYPYFWTMFPKDDNKALLQKCATADELLSDPTMQRWMSDAHVAAQKGKLQPYPISVPHETFSCEVAYLQCMQQPSEGAAYEWARVLTVNYPDVLANCRKDPAKLKYVVWWGVFLLWRDPATGAQRVIAENYELTEGQEPLNLLNEQELIAGVVAIFRHFKLDTTIGDNVQAQEIWRFWLYCAQKDRTAPIPVLPTNCQQDIYHIARDNPTYAELGRRAVATGSQPIHGCSDKEQGEIYAWRGMNTNNCDTLVQIGVRSFNQNPSKAGECGWGNAFMQASDFRTQCSPESQNQVEQWVAACSQ